MPGIEELDAAARLELLVNGVVDYALYLINPEGLIVSWNTGAERLKGYSAQEVQGQRYETFFTPEDRAAGLPAKILAAAARDGRHETEGWRVRKDGSRFWALAVLDAVYGQDGSVIGFAKITRDMTERERGRQAILESDGRFRRLVEAVVDYAIFQLDPEGFVVTWNAGAEHIKGYYSSEIVGQHFSRFYTEDDRAAGIPAQALKRATAEGRFETEGWRVRKDGSRFYAMVVIDAIRNELGELVGFAKVTRDISERLEAQKALLATQEQLAASQKMEAVGQLSGGIAHDFNNLMMIVIGNLETAQRNSKSIANPKLERALGNAMRGAQRAAALTSRLLAFSRRQPLDPKPLEVNKFLLGTADFLQRSLGEKVEIQVVGGAGLWRIEADPNHLETAILNLAINARDAMPDGGKITLEATNIFADEYYCRTNPELTPGQYVLICISDEGTGMPADVIERAFEPFFTTKEPGQGTGLGLSQVYGFVKQSGGHVKIYSEVDSGTTVKIYLPRLLQAAHSVDETPDQVVMPGEREVILVVEDSDDLRSYLAEVLIGLDYTVLTAPNGAAALKILQSERHIDLLLTDVVMPGMSGRDLAGRAQTLRPNIRILYMTGYSRNAVVHQGRLDEGVELLQKPVSQSALARRVRDLLDRNSGKQ